MPGFMAASSTGARQRIRQARAEAKKKKLASFALKNHFGDISSQSIRVIERTFPLRVRVDLHEAIRSFVEAEEVEQLVFTGVYGRYASHGGIGFVDLLDQDRNGIECTPPQYEQVDIGEDREVDCLKNGLWLFRFRGLKMAALMAEAGRYGQIDGVGVHLAIDPSEPAQAAGAEVFNALEKAIEAAGSYRGKILSLERDNDYSGRSAAIKVHKLRSVRRDQVILPSHTLQLLDRNVLGFVAQRERLRQLGHSTKKGVLFYGPPGTGKTHTLHYLAGALPDHTTLLLTSEQVGLLSEYMSLARLLQPSVMFIEDADLIARNREDMESVCEEVLLNKLLNEMDGLREDADILFVLTTNRPSALEAALSSRPGRIDQAIEFPLPDDEGRTKLVDLYARGVGVDKMRQQDIVGRTAGSSAAFIKELMRRATQFQLEVDDAEQLSAEAIDQALEQMLFHGGELNRQILGGVD